MDGVVGVVLVWVVVVLCFLVPVLGDWGFVPVGWCWGLPVGDRFWPGVVPGAPLGVVPELLDGPVVTVPAVVGVEVV